MSYSRYTTAEIQSNLDVEEIRYASGLTEIPDHFPRVAVVGKLIHVRGVGPQAHAILKDAEGCIAIYAHRKFVDGESYRLFRGGNNTHKDREFHIEGGVYFSHIVEEHTILANVVRLVEEEGFADATASASDSADGSPDSST